MFLMLYLYGLTQWTSGWNKSWGTKLCVKLSCSLKHFIPTNIVTYFVVTNRSITRKIISQDSRVKSTCSRGHDVSDFKTLRITTKLLFIYSGSKVACTVVTSLNQNRARDWIAGVHAAGIEGKSKRQWKLVEAIHINWDNPQVKTHLTIS